MHSFKVKCFGGAGKNIFAFKEATDPIPKIDLGFFWFYREKFQDFRSNRISKSVSSTAATRI